MLRRTQYGNNMEQPTAGRMVICLDGTAQLIAPLGVLFNIFLMTQVRIHTWYAFIIWGTLGVIVYFLYSKRNSNLEKK